MASENVLDSRKRNHSGSFSSNEYEDDFLSPSSEAEANSPIVQVRAVPNFQDSKM